MASNVNLYVGQCGNQIGYEVDQLKLNAQYLDITDGKSKSSLSSAGRAIGLTPEASKTGSSL